MPWFLSFNLNVSALILDNLNPDILGFISIVKLSIYFMLIKYFWLLTARDAPFTSPRDTCGEFWKYSGIAQEMVRSRSL